MTLARDLLHRIGVPVDSETLAGVGGAEWRRGEGDVCTSLNPADGRALGAVAAASRSDYERVVAESLEAFAHWRRRPAPARGQLIRELGESLRCHQASLGQLVSLETGKIASEGAGEVQEMIDICDFAVGLSRQLYGVTMASERPEHRLFEQWHPLGPVGVITAFNFPVAVWAWNAAIATVCGDTVIWKPSPQAPLTAIAVQHLAQQVAHRHEADGVFSLCTDIDGEAGRWIAEDRRLPLVSATGSCRMGRQVGAVVAERLGRSLLELGGNNAAIIMPSADLDLTLRAVVFSAVGTAGQRCTTLRRLLVHKDLWNDVSQRLQRAYASVPVGDPLEPGTLMGPLISDAAVESMLGAIQTAQQQGGRLLYGGRRLDMPGCFVEPALIQAQADMSILQTETFAPILYLIPFTTLEEAIAIQNAAQQGLSSSIFTDRGAESEQFLSPWGSDCGIANVNIGTSGAEIGGAFGGEKDTGGGREAGSDAWKAYMRRQTCTVNFGAELPLAQGVRFEMPRDRRAQFDE